MCMRHLVAPKKRVSCTRVTFTAYHGPQKGELDATQIAAPNTAGLHSRYFAQLPHPEVFVA
jgi:hypothetical protein